MKLDMVYDEERGSLVATRELEKGESATVTMDGLVKAFGWDGFCELWRRGARDGINEIKMGGSQA